jgi:hypothetical protein
MKFKILDDVPIPERKTGPESKFDPLLTMKKGQSVVVETLNDAKAVQMLFSRHNMLATMRKQKDDTYMIWRVF